VEGNHTDEPAGDIVMAMRPTEPALPFTIPNNTRSLDVAQPLSITNLLTNFGHEYAWHCHILGHEEFDLMRPMIFNADQLLYACFTGTGIQQ
jgi:FtsP/CotA-like multicopper oxidase with cupredoxin domain